MLVVEIPHQIDLQINLQAGSLAILKDNSMEALLEEVPKEDIMAEHLKEDIMAEHLKEAALMEEALTEVHQEGIAFLNGKNHVRK
jgi:uncharacterized protein YpbB